MRSRAFLIVFFARGAKDAFSVESVREVTLAWFVNAFGHYIILRAIIVRVGLSVNQGETRTRRFATSSHLYTAVIVGGAKPLGCPVVLSSVDVNPSISAKCNIGG